MEKLRTMNPEQAAALFRTLLQVAGAIGATAGWFSDSQWAVWSGAAFTVAITLWGVFARRDTALISSAANVPAVEKVVASPPVAAAMRETNVVAHALPFLIAMPLLGLLLGGCVATASAPPAVAVTVPAPAEVSAVQRGIRTACGLRASANFAAQILLSLKRDSAGLAENAALVNAAVLGACRQLGYAALTVERRRP